MIPIRDSIRSRRFPLVNILIIILNVIVYLYEISLSQQELVVFYTTWGVIPARFFSPLSLVFSSGWAGFLPLFTALFIHGGWLHIGSNMLYLWVFGDNVEDRFGHLGYLGFYLLVGLISNLTQVVFSKNPLIPTIGASGAVAGVLGAYFLMFPRSRVLAIVPFFVLYTMAEVPAVLFLFLWFALQLVSGVATLGVPAQVGGGVAYWAHIGGFVAGLLLVSRFKKKERII